MTRGTSASAELNLQTKLARILTAAALFLVSLVVIMRPLSPLDPGGSLASNALALLLLFGLCLLLSARALDGGIKIPRTSLNIPMLVFAAAVLVSMFTASYFKAAVLSAQDFLGYVVLFFLVVLLAADDRRMRRYLLFLLLASAAVTVAIGLHQHLWGFDDMLKRIRLQPETVMSELGIGKESWPDYVSRAETRELFSTFVLSNSFAGFLILTLPITAALLWQRLYTKNRKQRLLAGLPLALLLAGEAVCLYLTRSKGGWLALVLAALLAPIVGVGMGIGKRYKLAGLALAALIMVGGISTYFLAPDLFLPQRPLESMGVRVGYWQGAWQITKHHPLLGVGLGGFSNRYLWYKLPAAREVQSAHNNFLQVLVEMGAVGFACFLGVWVMLFAGLKRFRHGAGKVTPTPEKADTNRQHKKRRKPPTEQPLTIHILGLVAGPAAMFLLYGFGELQGNWVLPLSLIWLVFYATQARADGAGNQLPDPQPLRWGLTVGIMAFLVHSLVDIDLYVPGIAASVFVVLAYLALEMRSGEAKDWHWRPGWKGRLVVWSCSIVLVTVFANGVYFPLSESTARKQIPPDVPRREAMRRLEKAATLGPDDAEAYENLGHLYFISGDINGAKRCFERGLELKPESFVGYQKLAAVYRALGIQDPRQLQDAERFLQEALKRYPTLPDLHLELAEVLADTGRAQEAINEYAQAIKLAELATQRVRRFTEEKTKKIRSIMAELEKQPGEGTSGARTGEDG